jgi:hypothetical protein
MMPRPDAVRHLPGWRLRRLAERLCSSETLEHVVDPILADLQHEWNEAAGRSGPARGWVCLAGYAAFFKALTLHMLMTASRHLAGNAFGATPEERAFYGRAGSATAAALLVQTAIIVFTSTGTGVRSLVYALTHQRWPGGPSEAESLPRALAIAFHPDLLASLLPSVVVLVLPTSLLFGLLVAARKASSDGASIRPQARWVAGASLFLTTVAIAVTGWVMPVANQNYREIVVAALYRTDRKANVPAKGIRELTFGELGDAIQSEQSSSGRYLAPYRRTERHKRVALPAACAVFGLLAMGLADMMRGRGALVVALTATAVAFLHYFLLRLGEQVLMPLGAAPFVCAWGATLVVACAAAILIVSRRSRLRAEAEVSSAAP